MVVVSRTRSGAYFDSVTLMNVARELSDMEGVEDAAVVMATRENLAILESSGLLTNDLAGVRYTDLVIAVRASSRPTAESALDAVDDLLAGRSERPRGRAYVPKSLDAALRSEPDLDLALISVAGRYAGDVALEAIERGLHVMLFSDNVPLETEVALKTLAHEKGLLVMGPDCGTAVVNGVPLGFANAVSRGPVGIVAASGTGLQEVSTLLDEEGVGISQALGTGSRDVSDAVGGITFLDALDVLDRDPGTEVVVLVSKPPGAWVHETIRAAAGRVSKPVVSVFLGIEPAGELEAATLAGAAAKAAAVSRGEPLDDGKAARQIDVAIREFAEDVATSRGGRQRFLRALMSGGTFASEAALVLGSMGLSDLRANVRAESVSLLEDSLRSAGNTIVDMGADEFTVGRPHPMIDYSIRRRRLVEESRDPETAVILLDVVLGYGTNPDPAGELEGALREAAPRVAVVCSVTGTERDPQVRSVVEGRLRRSGAIVMPSNEHACRLAGEVVRILGGSS